MCGDGGGGKQPAGTEMSSHGLSDLKLNLRTVARRWDSLGRPAGPALTVFLFLSATLPALHPHGLVQHRLRSRLAADPL